SNGASRIRTGDLVVANHALCQLSYGPVPSMVGTGTVAIPPPTTRRAVPLPLAPPPKLTEPSVPSHSCIGTRPGRPETPSGGLRTNVQARIERATRRNRSPAGATARTRAGRAPA